MASRRMRIKAVANVPSFNKSGRDRPTTPTPSQLNDLRLHPPSPYLQPESPSLIIPSSPRPSPSISPMILFSPGSPTKKFGSFTSPYSPAPSPSPKRPETPKTPLSVISYHNEDSNSRKSTSDLHQSNSDPPPTTFGDISITMDGEFLRPRSSMGLSNTISALQKEFPNNSSESLRQRLAKVPNLSSTSKYATVRKEFINKFKVYSTKEVKVPSNELTMLHYAFWNPPSEIKKEKIEEEKRDVPKSPEDKTIPSPISTPIVENVIEKKEPSGPRVKVGPDGQLIVDEKSLMIESSETKRAKEQIERMEVVSAVPSGFYRMKRGVKRGNDWTVKETIRFYRALSTCGSDFSMMTHMFPHRTRAELKAKFKREDRRNPQQVSKALSCQCFDPLDGLSSESEEEQEHPGGNLNLKSNLDFEILSSVEEKIKQVSHLDKIPLKKGRPRNNIFSARKAKNPPPPSNMKIVEDNPSPLVNAIPSLSTEALNIASAALKKKYDQMQAKDIKKEKKEKSIVNLSMPSLFEVTPENENVNLSQGGEIKKMKREGSNDKLSKDRKIIKLELAETTDVSQGQTKVVPYRVPGPGNTRGKASTIDEIEFEISCQ